VGAGEEGIAVGTVLWRGLSYEMGASPEMVCECEGRKSDVAEGDGEDGKLKLTIGGESGSAMF